ncbi:MAG: N-acetyl-gamma-glutamyl-phosphate reductase [Planctomycetota bacterium]|jgi:N-acetyl-gamma-glutamyl-phosphate reductase|nr:N-acetyl-gamma-glutamyl-phosphate reductase [Planctomycetota bacterium]
MKRAIVVGSSGYAGQELCGLLAGHAGIELWASMSARSTPPSHEPTAEGQIALDPERFCEADVVFLCTPHGKAAALARMALDAGSAVVDLSADLRLRDPKHYAEVYGLPHPAPELLEQAVYGLTERARTQLAGAQAVANPGCYPTSVLLPVHPLLDANLLAPQAPIVADAKSGVSGAGKAPTEVTHFGNVHENFRAYQIGIHRHEPEMAQEAGVDRLVFVPHLLPCLRGILTTLYLTPHPGQVPEERADEFRACLREAYAGEPFVQVLDGGTPELKDVLHTNRCHIAVHPAGPLVVVTSALDNLVKGAAGQAMQNANLLLGLEETLGLPGALHRPAQAEVLV